MHKYKVEFMHLKTGKIFRITINEYHTPFVALELGHDMMKEILNDYSDLLSVKNDFSEWLFVKMEIVSY